MTTIIGTAGCRLISHETCGKGICRVIDGVLHVECTRRGCKVWVPLPEFVERDPLREAIGLILSGQVKPADVIALASQDYLAEYRQIKGLTVFGPPEWRLATTNPDGKTPQERNPLGLSDDWCPVIPVPRSIEEIRERVKMRIREGARTPTLFLDLERVGDELTSLPNQYGWWGIAFDGLGPGRIRGDIFRSNWFIGHRFDRVDEPSVVRAVWKLKYEFHTALAGKGMDWPNQQMETSRRGLQIASAASDTLYMNAMAATGQWLRKSTGARTSTIRDDGYPLDVFSDDRGVFVSLRWFPEAAIDLLSVAAEEVL